MRAAWVRALHGRRDDEAGLAAALDLLLRDPRLRQRAALLPHRGRGIGPEQAIADPERPPQLEVGPVVQGIAQRVRYRLSPGQELVAGAGYAGDLAFSYAVGPHGPPLIVIAVQPNPGDILEFLVTGNFIRRQMAVIINDG